MERLENVELFAITVDQIILKIDEFNDNNLNTGV
jgi:hypothetical protein